MTAESPNPMREALRSLRNAAQEVMDGLHRRIDEAPKYAVPVFSGIARLHGAIAQADAALSTKQEEEEVSRSQTAASFDPDTQKAAATDGALTPTGAANMLVTIYGHPNWTCTGLETQALLVARTYLADLKARETPTHTCTRCGQNHYDHSRPTTPPCPFPPQKLGPGGLR